MSHRRPESHPPHHPRRVSCLPSAWGSSSPVTQGSGLTAGHKESDMTEWLTTFTLHVGDHVIHCLKQDTLQSKNGRQGPQTLIWHEVTVAKLLSSLMPWASESKRTLFFFFKAFMTSVRSFSTQCSPSGKAEGRKWVRKPRPWDSACSQGGTGCLPQWTQAGRNRAHPGETELKQRSLVLMVLTWTVLACVILTHVCWVCI